MVQEMFDDKELKVSVDLLDVEILVESKLQLAIFLCIYIGDG